MTQLSRLAAALILVQALLSHKAVATEVTYPISSSAIMRSAKGLFLYFKIDPDELPPLPSDNLVMCTSSVGGHYCALDIDLDAASTLIKDGKKTEVRKSLKNTYTFKFENRPLAWEYCYRASPPGWCDVVPGGGAVADSTLFELSRCVAKEGLHCALQFRGCAEGSTADICELKLTVSTSGDSIFVTTENGWLQNASVDSGSLSREMIAISKITKNPTERSIVPVNFLLKGTNQCMQIDRALVPPPEKYLAWDTWCPTCRFLTRVNDADLEVGTYNVVSGATIGSDEEKIQKLVANGVSIVVPIQLALPDGSTSKLEQTTESIEFRVAVAWGFERSCHTSDCEETVFCGVTGRTCNPVGGGFEVFNENHIRLRCGAPVAGMCSSDSSMISFENGKMGSRAHEVLKLDHYPAIRFLRNLSSSDEKLFAYFCPQAPHSSYEAGQAKCVFYALRARSWIQLSSQDASALTGSVRPVTLAELKRMLPENADAIHEFLQTTGIATVRQWRCN
jgi:hypothetical protein